MIEWKGRGLVKDNCPLLMKGSVDCWLVEPVRNRSCVRSPCSYRRSVKWASWISWYRSGSWRSWRRNVRSDNGICGLCCWVIRWRSAVLGWRSGESVTNIQNGAELLHDQRYSGLSLLKAFIVTVTSDRVDDKQGNHSVFKQMNDVISSLTEKSETFQTYGSSFMMSWCRMVLVVANPVAECLTIGCTGHLICRDRGSIATRRESFHNAQVNEKSVIEGGKQLRSLTDSVNIDKFIPVIWKH